MPRSSRHKSHKQSKHSSKEAKDYYSDSDEDVRMKERNSSKEDGGGYVRVSKDSSHSASGEKRKLSSSSLLKEGKDGKDLSGNGNGDVIEDYGSSKRRKDKAEGGDRWNGGGDDKDDGGVVEKEIKGESLKIDSDKVTKSKGLGDSKSKSSKRHESGGEKEERNVGLPVEKEERSGSRSESKRKSEKESGRKEGKESKEMKEKDRGSDREKKSLENKRDFEVRPADGVLTKKQGSQWEDGAEDRQSKRGRENTDLPIQDELRNSESEKELEKRIRRRRDGSGDGDRSQDARESDERHISSRGDRAKDGKYKDERYKDGSYGDKNQDDAEKDDRHREIKYREDADKDIKYRDDGDRDSRHRDDKYREDGEKDDRRREDKYREDGSRDTRRKDEKYRDDGERDSRRRDDKYREDGERENKRRDDKYREDGDKDSRRSDDRHYEDGERDDRYRDDKYREDSDRYKEEKRREDCERDSRRKDGKQGDDVDREKRLRDAKYKDERASRDRSGDKADIKHSRDETHVADLHSRKSSIRDSSPNYDDRARFKGDQGRKRSSDKDDQIDVKSRSTKDQRYDGEKRLTSSARVDVISDRGRSTSRNADLELTPNRSRHQGSPGSSSHVTREHYRLSKQEYREYAYEERARHGVTSTREHVSATDKISSSRITEKFVQKDDSHLVELSAERRLKTDARTSPRQLFDKSPSSTSADRRHGSRSDVRRSIDVEESGQRSGGSRDAKDYPGKEGRGIRDLAMEMLPVDDLSQADGDNLSVSSPFARTGNLSGSSKSLLPPPFRTGMDSPLNFGSSEDDSRMKFNTRHRRISDSNMGRVQGSPWKAVPSWPSPMANGFMPFQHGPPPVGFHPVIQQFPPAPIFGVRPSMELNHPGVPYHISDAERFPGHGRPMGWRNPVDDSCPPPLHGWDANNAPFGEESHVYGRPDWDHSRTLSGSRGWEASGEMWKGPKSDVSSMELHLNSQKENRFTSVPVDVALAGQAAQQAQIEQIQPDLPAESIETSQSSDALQKRTPENPKVTATEAHNVPKKSGKDDRHLFHVYLSKLDISADLTDPELYRKCRDLLDMDEKIICDSEDAEILYVQEASGMKEQIPSPNKKALLFATINDSVFQKAMTLYKKCREECMVISGENTTLARLCNKSIMKFDQEMHLPESNEAEQLLSADGELRSEDGYSNYNQEVKQSVCIPKLEEVSPQDCEKLDEPVVADVLEKSDKTIMNIKEELVTDQEFQEQGLNNAIPIKDVESSTCLEDVVVPSNSMGNELTSKAEEQTPPDTKCGSLLLADVSSKACEVVMPESVESGSVNLSRIHHSPENTH